MQERQEHAHAFTIDRRMTYRIVLICPDCDTVYKTVTNDEIHENYPVPFITSTNRPIPIYYSPPPRSGSLELSDFTGRSFDQNFDAMRARDFDPSAQFFMYKRSLDCPCKLIRRLARGQTLQT